MRLTRRNSTHRLRQHVALRILLALELMSSCPRGDHFFSVGLVAKGKLTRPSRSDEYLRRPVVHRPRMSASLHCTGGLVQHPRHGVRAYSTVSCSLYTTNLIRASAMYLADLGRKVGLRNGGSSNFPTHTICIR